MEADEHIHCYITFIYIISLRCYQLLLRVSTQGEYAITNHYIVIQLSLWSLLLHIHLGIRVELACMSDIVNRITRIIDTLNIYLHLQCMYINIYVHVYTWTLAKKQVSFANVYCVCSSAE